LLKKDVSKTRNALIQWINFPFFSCIVQTDSSFV
jgi:hypothetical protein